VRYFRRARELSRTTNIIGIEKGFVNNNQKQVRETSHAIS